MKAEEQKLYEKYEELIIKRDALIKEANIYGLMYTRNLGDLIIEVFQEKIESIRLKKAISYCQTIINRGETLDARKLEQYIKKNMIPFEDKLKIMIDDFHSSAKRYKSVSNFELRTIKFLYQKIAKLLHPDINPLTQSEIELMELWDRTVKAYKSNDVEELEKLEILVGKTLRELNYENAPEIIIANVEKKIEDIEKEIIYIQNSPPYNYKTLLDNPNALDEKRRGLISELEHYQKYNEELEEILQKLKLNHGGITLQ